MSIPWVIGIGTLLTVFVASLGSLYLDSYDWRHSQIGLDNLAIEVGKEDTAILEMVRGRNSTLKKMEKAHHVLHACARVIWTAAFCTGPDRIAEAAIRLLVKETEIEAQGRWVKNGIYAHSQLLQIGKGGTIQRLQTAPIRTETCPICHLENRFSLTSTNLHFHLQTWEKERHLQVGIELLGTSLTQSKKWNYKLGLK